MKITCYTVLIGLTCLLTAKAQTNSASSAPPVETNSEPVTVTTATNTMASPPATEPMVATTNASPETPDNTAPAVAVGIPQIKLSDVPITTAIENLARLANINY